MITPRTLYCVGLLSWVGYVFLFPTWIGRSYNRDIDRTGAFHEGGVFGLRGGDGFTTRAPLWDPPQPAGDGIDAAVRWPGERVTQSHHIELALGNIAARLSLGVLVLGLLLGAYARLNPSSQPGRLVSFAWSLLLALVIAWICILVVGAFTFGYGLTDEVILAILTLGALGGCVYAFLTSRHRSSSAPLSPVARERAGPPPSDDRIPPARRDWSPARRAPLSRGRTAVGPVPGRQPTTAGASLLWFTTGIILALCLTVAAGWIASFFRGSIAGVTELGTTRYESDQAPVNMVTGLGILTAGWTIGLVTLHVGPSRNLSVGLIVGATLLAIAFALS